MLEMGPAYAKQMLHLCDARVWKRGRNWNRYTIIRFLANFTTKKKVRYFFSCSDAKHKEIRQTSVTIAESPGQRPTTY